MTNLESLDATCSLCKRSMRHWMSVPNDCKKGKPNEHSEVYWCEKCAYGAVSPMPTPDEVAEFYQLGQYYTQGESHFAPDGPVSFMDRLRIHMAWRMDDGSPTTADTIHQALGMRPSRIVDLGCGGGGLAAALAELGHTVIGVEVDPMAISHRNRGRFTVYQGTAEALPAEVASQKFDCVVMCHVLEHCREPVLALRNARSILRSGGKFICEVPNNASAALVHLGCAWEMFDVPRHLHFFTRNSLVGACEQVGLSVEETVYAHFTRQFTNAWINTERMLWKNLMKGSRMPKPVPVQNSKANAWRLLARTMLAKPEVKYDCVRITAIPAECGAAWAVQ